MGDPDKTQPPPQEDKSQTPGHKPSDPDKTQPPPQDEKSQNEKK